MQIAGTNEAMVKVRADFSGADYTTATGIFADFSFVGCSIRGGDVFDNPTYLDTLTNQNGFDLQNAAVNPVNAVRVSFEDCEIEYFARNGIYGANWKGYVIARKSDIMKNWKDGIRADSCFDWRFYETHLHDNGQDGQPLSGCGKFVFVGCNVWSNVRRGTTIFNDASSYNVNHKFIGGSCDRNGEDGYYIDMRAAIHVIRIQMVFEFNGAKIANTYSDIRHAVTSIGTVKASGCSFGWVYDAGSPMPRENVKYNAEFQGTTGRVEFDGSCFFAGTYPATNAVARCEVNYVPVFVRLGKSSPTMDSSPGMRRRATPTTIS